MYATVTHLVYILVSIAFTIWVGRTLHKRGYIFVLDAFRGNEALAEAVNHLLIVGFYLVNIGFIALYLNHGEHPKNLVESIEVLSTKLGVVLLVLGGLHYFNIFNFYKMRAKAKNSAESRPIPKPLI